MRRALLSAVLSGVLVAAAFAPAVAAPSEPATSPPAEKVGKISADEAALIAESADAVARAKETGTPIEVMAATTPTDRLLALPDGTMQFESSTVPVRTERAEGEWVPVNTELVRRDDWWEPAASATPVRFTAGGSDVVSQVRTPGGEWLTETWPHGRLPEPFIEGRTATYPEVLPGVDLKLTATELGMASVYVVKTPQAAASKKLARLQVDLEGARITQEKTGVFTAKLDNGDAITASSPLWWDSADGGTAEGPGDAAPAMPVAHSLNDTGIALDVASTIDGERPRYPIFIDPDWSSGPNAAWYTDAAYPNQSYLSAGTSDVLRMGRFDTHRGNAFFEFNIAALAGKQVLAAHLSTTQTQVAAWPNNPVQLRLFGHQDAGFTWNQQNHNLWGPVLGTQSPGTWGGPAVTVGWGVTSGVQARLGQTWVQFGLAPENESVQSRRHFSRAATLTVNYNTAPNAPTAPQIDSPQRACGTASAPAHVSGSQVVVSVHQTDPDGGNVDTNFHLYNGSLSTHLQSKAPGLLAQGRRSVTWTGLSEGTYAWYARGSDWNIDGNGTSPWCYFTLDNTSPSAPSATTSATSFTVGQPISVNLASSADTAGYQYWFSYTAPTATAPPSPVSISRTTPLPDCTKREGGTRFACANGSTPVAISVAPVDALSTLWVSAYDKSGNVSTAKALALFTSTGTPAARDPRVDTGHAWMTTMMIDPLPTVIDDHNTSLGSGTLPLEVPDDGSSWQKVTELRPGYSVPVLWAHEPPEAGMAMRTPGAAVNTSDSFTVSMWVEGNYYIDQPTQVLATHYASGSSFNLKIQNGRFEFCRNGTYAAGETAPISSCVLAPTQLVQGEWVQVTGVWDRINQQLRLVVGDSAAPAAVAPNVKGSTETWAATNGGFEIGPPPTSWRFYGGIANPVVVPGVMDSRQLGSLASFATPFTF